MSDTSMADAARLTRAVARPCLNVHFHKKRTFRCVLIPSSLNTVPPVSKTRSLPKLFLRQLQDVIHDPAIENSIQGFRLSDTWHKTSFLRYNTSL